MTDYALAPIEAAGLAPHLDIAAIQTSAAPATRSFAALLTAGIDQVTAKVEEADSLSRAFILDDNIPVHQVTFALEQARLSMELMLQVRNRLIEGYQQLMNMPL